VNQYAAVMTSAHKIVSFFYYISLSFSEITPG